MQLDVVIEAEALRGSVAKGIFPLLGLLLITAAGIGRGDELAQGRAIYLQYCASCHGLDATGNGPMAPTLSIPPANLRKLSERYGNPLPADQIARFIDGRNEVKAHGPRDMPVWGRRFYPLAQGSERQIKVMIADLVDYLQSIQAGAGKTSREEGKGSLQLSDRAFLNLP